MDRREPRLSWLLEELFRPDEEKAREVKARAAQRRRLVAEAWSLRSSLGDGLERVRNVTDLSPDVLTLKAEVSREQYMALENGLTYPWDMSVDGFVQLLAVLGLPVNWVLQDVENLPLQVQTWGFVARSHGRMRRTERRLKQQADERSIRQSVLERKRREFVEQLREYC